MTAIFKAAFTKKPSESIYQFLLFLCLCIFVIGLPTSRSIVSISHILLAINWVAEANYKDKLHRFRQNKSAVYLIAVFFVYVLGLLWTQDLTFGIGTIIKNKLPYLTLIFVVVSSKPLPKERVFILPVLFSYAVVFTTVIGFIVFLTNPHANPRDMSPFFTHIHLGMMIIVAIFLLPWISKEIKANSYWFRFSVLISVWLFVFLFMMSTLTALISMFILSAFLLLRSVINKPSASKMAVTGISIIAPIVILYFLISFITAPIYFQNDPDPESLNETTREGNQYTHRNTVGLRENGYLVYYFIAEDELRNAWNNRSEVDFDSLDRTGHQVKHTIYRYLTSKGLRKDKEGLSALDDHEIKAIEHGVPNYLYVKWPNIFVRIHQTFWELNEYERTGNPSGHSMAQRIEVWKATIEAIKVKPILGWGTGDHLHGIHYGLDMINSRFENFNLRHAHNQLLNIWLMHGIIGVIMIFGLYYMFIYTSRAWNYLPFNVLLVVVVTSMFVNCPLDSQMPLNLLLFFCLYFGILYPSIIFPRQQ